MLSQILNMNPDVLSLSEFWNIFIDHQGTKTTRDIPTHVMSGEEYWQLLTRCDPHYDGLVATGIESYFGRRFNAVTGVPTICRVLGPLTSDPDTLYGELDQEVPTWPRRPMADHCRALFADLATILGRRVVVERTGGGLAALPMLRQQFPEARFVYLHRNGPDSALSMSRHPIFRLLALKFALTFSGQAPPFPLLEGGGVPDPEEVKGLLEPPFDVERFMAYPLSLKFFGRIWSKLTCAGVAELREVPHDKWLIMRYEDLINDTAAELATLTDFIGVPADARWLAWAGEFVEAGRPRAAAQLDPCSLAGLETACAPGAEAYKALQSEHDAALVKLSS